MKSPRMRISALCTALVLGLVPVGGADAQQGDELARLIAMYRSGSSERAAAGLGALVRTAETGEQRALLEYHLGFALLRARPSEATAALRRSISLDPDLRPDSAVSSAERIAWEGVRSQMLIPVGVRFEPATTIPGTGDSLGLVVDVPVATGIAQPRVRLLLVLPQGRDPLELWTGVAGERGMWDGTFSGELPRTGTYPLIVEMVDASGATPLRWRRSLKIDADAVTLPLSLAPRPQIVRAVIPIRVSDLDRRKRARRRGIVWALGGGVVSFLASRTAPDVIKLAAPNSGPRIALATVYGAGLVGAFYGTTKFLLSSTRRFETTVLVPDEALLRRQRFAEAVWLADSARVVPLNARLDSLRRISVQVMERR